jgi:amidase/aspartyl-tRNA(Asn)/glutamyl-tRNA(Gln) amidotransferase subunit A
MALADELAYMSATELALKIRTRTLSPVEVVDACISRIEQRNPSLNAFVFTGFDEARQRAQAAEQALMTGAELGPLHGVPTAMKDLFGFKPGWKNTFGGIPAFKDYTADTASVFAARIEHAGAILLGKTNSPIMGFCGCTDNPLFGPTSTPFRIGTNSGGSSGGSAAAVADGLVPFAHGTDGGGSIRIPAAWCGVFGYKPSLGRMPYVSRPDAFSGLGPYRFEGPLTRTVEDAALAMSALAGYDWRDPFSLADTVDFLGATRRSIRGMKIAFTPDWDIFPVESPVAETVARAVQAFREAGAHVEQVKIGITRSQQELADLWCRMVIVRSNLFFAGWKARGLDVRQDRPNDLPPGIRRWLAVGDTISAVDRMRDQALQTEVFDAINGTLQTYDLIVSPTLACMPVANGSDGDTVGPSLINGEPINERIGWCITYLINFSGNPAASVPAGLVDGLPVGMQITGRRNADADVFAAAAAFERLRPWFDTYRIPAGRAVGEGV